MNAEIKERVAAINSGIIPEGYKKTKVGIVPVEWDIKALGKISQFLDNQRKPVKENERSSGIYPYYGASGIIDYVDDYLFDGEYILLGEDGANIVMRSSPLAFKVKGKMWINNHAHVISPNDNCNIDFLVNILESLNYEKYNSGTAQPKLNREVCESITLPFPPLPEQQKIAEILSTQDKLIELQEKKIEQLKELKKAYLQKMFPQKGSKYPELRFKGFTEPWEQRKVGEISECLDSMRVPLNANERKQMQGDIPYYGAGSIQDYINKYLFDEELVLLLEDGDAFDDFKTKSIAQYISGKSWVNNHAHILRAYGNAFFLYISLAHKDIRNVIQLAGASRKKLVQDAMLRIVIDVPSIDEQVKIGEFFKQLDSLITLHQRKSEQEKQKKKALMQLLLTGIVRTK